MATVELRVRDRTVPVHIGAGLVGRVGGLLRNGPGIESAVVVADSRVTRLHGKELRSGLRRAGVKVPAWIDVPPGEKSKNLSRVRSLYTQLVDARAERWTAVVTLGGGVVGDLAGFAASTFLRGLPLVHVPTTVVGQVDSAIGGKTAVNFAGAKNLIGSFHQPEMVICDTALLATLSPRDYRAGLAEAVKIAVTLRPDLMAFMEDGLERLRDRQPDTLEEVVRVCVEAKGDVVSRDEREQDVRAILNYGHTIGHALEAEQNGRLRHGEAVAVGMRAAAWIGEGMGVTDPEVPIRQNALLEALGLKLACPGADKRVVTRNLKLDKKVRARKNRFVLTLQIGGASVWPRISERLLRDAVRLVTS